MSHTAHQKADEYLRVSAQFRLQSLPTEQRHPLTHDLAHLSRHDIPQALQILKGIDVGVIADMAEKGKDLGRLRRAINDTIRNGDRVFFYGCGATGRLSLSIGYLWRSLSSKQGTDDQVVDFMSGGDLALVHSIESFEDHPEYGARQLRELGFGPNDLLVSCTEGGETPSVIGATEEAARLSRRSPFFLYCNPDDALRNVERSRRVLDHPRIKKICLSTGPMALSGSTRMQASTVLMLVAGAALMGVTKKDIGNFRDFLQKADFSFLEPFVKEEARLYKDGHFTLYETNHYGMTILTDTTERAPTFSLRGFENQNDPGRTPSLSYFRLPDATAPAEAWGNILRRPPVPIEWQELRKIAGIERLLGFDFSRSALGQREELVGAEKLQCFVIKRNGDMMQFSLGKHQHEIDVSTLHPLFEQLFLKIALNMHSTLVMGNLGRYESNVMTWVKPSNNKLIDRAIRYVQHLLDNEGTAVPSYENICYRLFEERETLKPDESIVLKTFESLKHG